MSKLRDFDFISRLYDLALSEGQWTERLDEFCTMVDAGGATVIIVDPIHQSGAMLHSSSIFTPELMDEYNAKWAARDSEDLALVARCPERHFVHDFEVRGLSIGEAQDQLPVLQWTYEKTGNLWRTATRVNLSGAWLDFLALQYSKAHGPMRDTEKQHGALFLPHFAKVIEIRRAFRVLEQRFNSVLGALDKFNIGVAISLADGQVVLRNREAQRIFELRDGIGVSRGNELTATEPACNADLRQAILATSRTVNGEGTESEVLLSIPRRSGTDSFLVSVSPLRDDRNDIERGFTGSLIFVIDPANQRTISPVGIAAVFGLTKAEADVLALMLAGETTERIAEVRGTSVVTCRNQIKSILAKTKCRTRADLIRLAVSVDLPIEGK